MNKKTLTVISDEQLHMISGGHAGAAAAEYGIIGVAVFLLPHAINEAREFINYLGDMYYNGIEEDDYFAQMIAYPFSFFSVAESMVAAPTELSL